jgi:hypothetical protein
MCHAGTFASSSDTLPAGLGIGKEASRCKHSVLAQHNAPIVDCKRTARAAHVQRLELAS